MRANKSVGVLLSMKTFMKMTPEERRVEAERIKKHKSTALHQGWIAWRRASLAEKEASK
tara:strand:- start:1104 stop:1280 length:177 start_codon:yes stop_codon:yes gene_type:complete